MYGDYDECMSLGAAAHYCYTEIFLLEDQWDVIASLALCLPPGCAEPDIQTEFHGMVAGVNAWLKENHTIFNHTFNLNYTLPPLRADVRSLLEDC